MTGGPPPARGEGGRTRPLPGDVRGSEARYAVLLGHPLHMKGARAHAPSPSEARPEAFRGRSDPEVAQYQWRRLVEQLQRLGLDILIAPADRKCPDMAWAGAAGLVSSRTAEHAVADKRFIGATTGEGRTRGVHLHFERIIRGLGYDIVHCDAPFAGDADLIECAGEESILTWGEADEGGRRLLGRAAPTFATAREVRERLSSLLDNRRLVEMRLVDPRYPRGDLCACAIGPGRRVLMVNVNAFHDDARRIILAGKLKATDYVIPLSERDAAMYAANAFEFTDRAGRRHLFIPEGVSDDLLARIDGVGVRPVPVAMSEWIKKDRGSVKSLICDLGWMCDDRRTLLPEVQDFRKSIRFRPS